MSSQHRQLQKLQAHIKVAQAYADLSYARRLQVGAVLIKDDRPIAVGYNGTPTGMDNNCEIEGNPDGPGIYNGGLTTKPEVVHAEMNAIAFAAKNGVSTDGAELVITHSPCYECSKLLIQSGISAVYYKEDYRDTEPLKLLSKANVTAVRIDDGEEN